MTLRPTSMMTKLVLFSLLLSLLVIGLIYLSSYYLARRDVAGFVLERLEGAAEYKAEQIRHWVTAQRQDIIFISATPEIKTEAEHLLNAQSDPASSYPAYEDLSRRLKLCVLNKPDLREIFLMSDRGGLIVISSDPRLEGEYRGNYQSFNYGRYSTFVQKVHPSPTTMEPIMTVSTPLVDDEGRKLGVLAANLDLDRMDRIILKRTGLGRTGEAYLVDKYNVFVSASRFGRENFLRGVHSPGIEAAIQGKPGPKLYLNYKGVPVIGTYRWIEDLGLALLVEMHQDEAFGPANRMVGTIALLGLASIIFLVGGIFFLARQITRPIMNISTAVSRMASGDLSARTTVTARDEIGTLALGFNQMAERLEGLYRGLEEKVEQLEEAEHALRQSEQYYRDFFENDLTGDFVADAEGRILSYNPAFSQILGFEPETAKHLPRLSLLLPSGEFFTDFMAELKRNQRLDYHQMVMQRLDGKQVQVVANFIAILNEDGRLKEIKGFLFDDTKRLELEEQLRHAQKMEALGRLAGGVAHDFNNLMTAVTGYSDLALAKLDQDNPLRAGIEQIAKAGERAASLTRQLLVFSRRQVLKPKIVDLNLIVLETEKMIRRLMGEDIEIITRLDPNLGQVKADDGQIQQVIMNLVINARDSMPEGGLLSIETGNNVSGGMPDRPLPGQGPPAFVRLTVADTGVGMDAETQSRVFDPFFTTKEQGKGTGLGLATVHGVVEQSGGRVIIDSELGCGSTFHVILPRVEGEAVQEEASQAALPDESHTEKILLVEDESVVRELTKEILELSGYQVIAVPDGQEALSVVQDQGEGIRLLLTDVVMPGLSGPELALEMRRERPELKVLFISGYSEEDLWASTLKKEGTAFLAKPFKPTDLVKIIRQVLDEELKPESA